MLLLSAFAHGCVVLAVATVGLMAFAMESSSFRTSRKNVKKTNGDDSRIAVEMSQLMLPTSVFCSVVVVRSWPLLRPSK